MTNQPEAMSWLNQDLILFHGTDSVSADLIRRGGIRLEKGRPARDFGKGFYTTTSLQQANDWAIKTSGRKSGTPEVLRFRAPRTDIAKLSTLAFVRLSPELVRFVSHCRSGKPGHGLESDPDLYDLVVGPVTTVQSYRTALIPGSDQFSFHTEAGVAALTLLTESADNRS